MFFFGWYRTTTSATTTLHRPKNFKEEVEVTVGFDFGW
jgi:hypothetical protein